MSPALALLLFLSLPLLMSSHKDAPLTPSRGTPQLRETYREGGGREARSAIGSRCMQTVGRVRHLAPANDGVVVVVTVTVHFPSIDDVCTQCRNNPCSRRDPPDGIRQPCVVTRRRRTLSCELCATRRRIIAARGREKVRRWGW